MSTPSVSVVLRDLEVGGVPRVYVSLLAELRRKGHRVRLLGGGGALAPEAQAAGIELVAIDWERPYPESFEAVLAGCSGFDAGVLVVDPQLVHAIPALRASTERTLFALHCSAPGLRQWFAPDHLERLTVVTRALRAGLFTIGAFQASEHGALFGIDSMGVLTPGIDVARFPFDPASGDDSVVLTVARLSQEKRWAIDAGISLTAARLAAGKAARLEVVGDGPWRADALALCRDALPAGAFRFHGASLDVAPHMRRAAVLLATGITALEGIAVGRPVVLGRPLTADTSLTGPVVLPGNLDVARNASFDGAAFEGLDPAAAWERIDAVTVQDLRELRGRVEREHGIAVAARELLAMLAAQRPGKEQGLALALGRAAAGLQQRLSELQTVADDVWRAKEWYAERLAAAQSERR